VQLFFSVLIVAIGASVGAIFRYGLSISFNHLSLKYNLIHWGTLIANWIGCFIAGFFLMWVVHKSNISDEWKLFILTGFCGALTTFSAFSNEVVNILQQGRLSAALFCIFAHVLGSLTLTFLGMFIAKSLFISVN